MRTALTVLGASALAALAALPAVAKTDPKKGPTLRWSHTYAAALEEAKVRGAVVFATFHAEH